GVRRFIHRRGAFIFADAGDAMMPGPGATTWRRSGAEVGSSLRAALIGPRIDRTSRTSLVAPRVLSLISSDQCASVAPRCPRRETKPFVLLQIGDDLEKIVCLRVTARAQHPHKALG